MASRLSPFLMFNGTARQAMEFYASVFGGNLAFDTYADFGDQDSSHANLIMHAILETDSGFTIMANDVTSEQEYQPMASVSMSLSGQDADQLHSYWDKLSEGGTITMLMQKQIWGDEFGMCIDKFGVSWMVNINQPAETS